MKPINRVILATLFMLVSTAPQAEVLSWRLTGEFTRFELGPLSGRFDYDTADGSFSNVAVDGLWVRYDDPSNVSYSTNSLTFAQSTAAVGPTRLNINGIDQLLDPAVASYQPIHILFDESINSPDFGIVWGAGDGFAQVVPEPASYALMLAGLGVVGGFMRARSHRTARTARSS